MKIAENVKQNIQPLFKNIDVSLVDVEYVKQFDGMHLIVYIDKLDGVTIEDCKNVAHLLDPVLEDLNPTNDERYFFDVSSYGLDKPLKYDFLLDKYINKMVSIKLYMKVDGLKDFDATLLGYDENSITLLYNDREIYLEKKQIATILPYIEF